MAERWGVWVYDRCDDWRLSLLVGPFGRDEAIVRCRSERQREQRRCPRRRLVVLPLPREERKGEAPSGARLALDRAAVLDSAVGGAGRLVPR